MRVIYALQPFPYETRKSIFLEGPTPRSKRVLSWRPKALKLLEERKYDGDVIIPETADGNWKHNYDHQIDWEIAGRGRSDVNLMWNPRDLSLDEDGQLKMPALSSNTEFGKDYQAGNFVLGCPVGAAKMSYLVALAERANVPVAGTLATTIDLALAMLGDGAYRLGPGESQTPLHVWKHPAFQSWYLAQRAAGNRFDGCHVLWTHWVGRPNKRRLFSFAAHVDVHVASERRNKSNELIIGRPDIASVILLGPDRGANDTEIALVREFRSPAVTSDGFIHEPPSGSSSNPDLPMIEVAAAELREEAGVDLKSDRLRPLGARQLAGTYSVHRSWTFWVQLTEAEFVSVRARDGQKNGVDDEERTYIEIRTIGALRSDTDVDWSVYGMVRAAYDASRGL